MIDISFCLLTTSPSKNRGHLRAYEIPEAGGQRFLFTSDNFCWEETVYLLQAIPGLEDKVPNVPDKSEYKRPDMYKVSNEKAKTVLGIKFKGLEQINHY